MKCKFIILSLFVFAHLIFFSLSIGEVKGGVKVSGRARIGVFPFENLSGSFLAEEKVMGILNLEILRSGKFEIADRSEIEDFLRKERIRQTNMIDTEVAQKLRMELGLDGVILGTVDLYKSGVNPEVGVSLTMVDLRSSDIAWGSSISYSGEDFSGFFGFGKISSPFILTQIIAEEMVRAIPDDLFELPPVKKKRKESQGS